ncbi:MAG: GTP cyclohydrolase I FolE [Bacteriovoracaceae bacterium]|nr:GTP cyclohydrolase I FolE [Bacteriovoracaceae bacterium]
MKTTKTALTPPFLRGRTAQNLMKALQSMMKAVGDDPDREGLRASPRRILRSWQRLYGGYQQKPEDILTTFEEKELFPHNQIILLKNIEFYSTCEHHLLPFFGKAHIAYLPSNRIVGISKLARILEIYARRLQLQERIGHQVTQALMTHLNALGAACVLEAQHFCMIARGVEKQNSIMVTSSLRGTFLKNPQTRAELMALIRS